MSGANAKSWQLAGSIGSFASSHLVGHVDVARPERGLSELRVGGDVFVGRLFCVERESETRENEPWPLPPKDVYVRDCDLVASFGAVSDWPYSPQIYWSVGAVDSVDGVIGSLLLLVSVQTHLLDTWPRIAAESQIVSDETLRVQTCRGAVTAVPIAAGDSIKSTEETLCIVHRLRDADISYVEIMLASDFRDVSLVRDAASGECLWWACFYRERMTSNWRLFVAMRWSRARCL
jgi:hypothetical protein